MPYGPEAELQPDLIPELIYFNILLTIIKYVRYNVHMNISITSIKQATDLRKSIFFDLENLNKNPDQIIAVTLKGKSKAILMSFELFESLVETVDILSDPELIQEIEKVKKDGAFVSLEEINHAMFVSDRSKKHGISNTSIQKSRKKSV